ncbi:hypothetical protein EMIHUDRAFT_252544 [Emiliania huxleyi CCMP1516]|uniref:Radial spoke protein 3 n=2 Tax=Emiliania huxleyi TaxID=2903 RepID=A0A0D3KJ68_EMIH1|nr:hypothetical protein EMIHUDRAFT_252544 [Emiliania huxleyi CCMP1516]EOD35803.1 hypothetical protein EMIHUDRAFT_252544 [Emiliania huxleyi CCMP1516]|eukprot:XP_005788232.1 hypothetical protein EMIHUDRAFT_252544 [Emiliania huxleyi CCMP1516]
MRVADCMSPVVRGSTYAAQVGPGTKEFDQTASQAKAKPKDVRKRQKPAADRSAPPPVDGRKHIELQTEQYLEELTDRPPEAEAEVQTDAFVELLPQPLFIPVKSGVDAGTQVEDGELFDFDVEPLLEVIVGKTIEQAMMEVMEEEELASMRAHQKHFEQIRNAELAEAQEAERRRQEEKEARIAQEKQRLEREKAVSAKSAVTQSLTESGFFYDPLEAEVREQFVPWLLDAMDDCARVARAIADDLITAASSRELERSAEVARLGV